MDLNEKQYQHSFINLRQVGDYFDKDIPGVLKSVLYFIPAY